MVLDGGFDDLFFIFFDFIIGDIIYGGGCYFYCVCFDVEGCIIIDFNKVYNFFCVFIDYVICLLLCVENELLIVFLVGEKIYGNYQI